MSTNPAPRRQALLVLGMHRSGTSALSGVLAQLGVEPPKTLMKPASDNPRGFWESKEIVAFHERLLASIGSVWSEWSEIDKASLGSEAAAEQIASLPDLIDQEFGDSGLFFVKDPRMCRFPEVWLSALTGKDIEAKAVISLRHPAEVASSLESRNRLGMVRSRLVWLRHVLDAEHSTRGIRRTFVPYTNLLASWRTEVERMARDLVLKWPVAPADAAPRIEEFLHAGLRHFSEAGNIEPASLHGDWVGETYAILRRLAREEDPAALQRLDEIRRDFNMAASAFAPAFREAEGAHAEAIADLGKRLEARAVTPMPSIADIVSGVEAKLAGLEARMKAGHRAEISGLAELMKVQQAAHRAEIAGLVESMRAAQAAHRSEIATLAESARVDVERQGKTLVALAGELQSRRQLADKLESRLREQRDELKALQRRFEQSNELYRQESAKRTAINDELERIVAEQRAALGSSAEKVRAAQREIGGLQKALEGMRTAQASDAAVFQEEFGRLRSAHAKDTAALQEELVRQRHLTERMANELSLVHNSKGWRFLNLLRRAVGRRVGVPQDRLVADIEVIENSGLFDRQWYLEEYADVAQGGMDPVEHYLRFGAAELRNPNKGFDTRSYLDRYPDVKAAGFNPLLHYIQFGMREGRNCRMDELRSSSSFGEDECTKM